MVSAVMMKNPPHPGRMLKKIVLKEYGSVKPFSDKSGMEHIHVCRVLDQKEPISSAFAVKLEELGLGEAIHWLDMQTAYDRSKPRYN